MSWENYDQSKRKRKTTVGFRVSEQENERIKFLVSVSGMNKQEFIRKSLEHQKIVVEVNPTIYLRILAKIEEAIASIDKYMSSGYSNELNAIKTTLSAISVAKESL